MVDYAQQAGQQTWLEHPKDPNLRFFDGSINGVKFRSYVNYDANGNAYIGNVHPIK
jgi:hypothetical protein